MNKNLTEMIFGVSGKNIFHPQQNNKETKRAEPQNTRAAKNV